MSNEELVTLIQSGQKEYMEPLYEQNRSFIYQIANRYQGFAEVEDLLQEGFLSLYDAVAGYDPDQGVKFLTYAEYWIKQRLQRYIHNQSTVCRIPVHQRVMIVKYQKFLTTFQREYNRKPSEAEISHFMGISKSKVRQLKKDQLIANLDSLDRPLGGVEDDSIVIGDSVADSFDLEEDVIDRIQHEQMNQELWDCVDSLEDRQAKVIRQRYQENMSLKAVGEQQGITTERVRQIQSKALRALRKSKNARRLKSYAEEFIMTDAYHSGLSNFRYTWTSSTERVAIKLLEERDWFGR